MGHFSVRPCVFYFRAGWSAMADRPQADFERPGVSPLGSGVTTARSGRVVRWVEPSGRLRSRLESAVVWSCHGAEVGSVARRTEGHLQLRHRSWCSGGGRRRLRDIQREQVFFSFFRFAFFIFPDFSAISHFSCPRFHFAFSCPRFHFAFSCPRFHFAFFLHSRRWRPPVIARRGKCRVSSLGVLGRVGERGHPGGRRQREQRRAGVHARKTRSGVRTQGNEAGCRRRGKRGAGGRSRCA